MAIVASLVATVWLSSEAYTIGWLDDAQQGLRDDGFAIIACYAVGLVLGTVLHSVPALLRGRPLAPAWGAAGLLAVYGAAVTGFAWLLAGVAPAMSSSRHRHDPGALYTTWLVCVLLPLAAVVCAGGLFPRRTAPDPVAVQPVRPDRSEPGPVALLRRGPLLVTGVFGWLIGGVVLILLLIAIVIKILA
ncbi:hypothetical protein Cs7R123_52980 [Catellatospora sp. TT07R-123]|nr:hypothetical protein Cs7R123_52980 [Catellatospora sp. TT07R-123]